MIRTHLLPGALVLLIAGCGVSAPDETDFGPAVPAGIACEDVLQGDEESLVEVLGEAKPGVCVVAASGIYTGAFVVPERVTLLAEAGSKVEFRGDQPKAAALELQPGAALHNVTVSYAGWIGIRVVDGPATLSNVTVAEAEEAAVYATCTRDACTAEDRKVSLIETSLVRSRMGLWAKGTRVLVEGGSVSEHGGSGLTSGFGVVATHGAVLTMKGSKVEGNAGEIGVFVDGEGGTEAHLSEVTVSNNGGRGVWVQKIDGTEESPRVSLERCSLLGNRLVGFGALAARGIIIVDGRVADTAKVKVQTDTGEMSEVGDGIGLFEGTGQTRIEGVELTANQRSQVLVDGGERGIIIVDGKVAKEGGDFGIVVQRTAEEVVTKNVESAQLLEGAAALPVSAAEMQAPAL